MRIVFTLIVIFHIRFVNLCSIDACDALQICSKDIETLQKEIRKETTLDAVELLLRNIDRRLRSVEQSCN